MKRLCVFPVGSRRRAPWPPGGGETLGAAGQAIELVAAAIGLMGIVADAPAWHHRRPGWWGDPRALLGVGR